MPSCITIFPTGEKIKLRPGENLFALLRRSGFGLESYCGGKGVCGKCKVFLKDHLTLPRSQKEEALYFSGELEPKERLACQLYPSTDLNIQIPKDNTIRSVYSTRLQLNGEKAKIHVDPPTRKKFVKNMKQVSSNERCEVSRLLRSLSRHRILGNAPTLDLSVLKFIPDVLKGEDGKVTVTLRQNEIMGIEPGNTTSRNFGIAVDLGTTNIACYLLRMNDGLVLDAVGCVNPQVKYGEDVISRASFASSKKINEKTLQSTLISQLNKLITSMCMKNGIRKEEVSEACVVGNTVMIHLLIGISTRNLIKEPYLAGNLLPLEIKARELKINILRGGYVYFPPGVGSFIGSDTIAMIVASNLYSISETCLAIDIGTNTEIVIVKNGNITACSCASGPAFEGTHLSSGMSASVGAVEKVKIDQTGKVTIATIGNTSPLGICGSGVVDALAHMLMCGIMDESGVLIKSGNHVRLGKNFEPEFILVNKEEAGLRRDILMTQKDIREVQLAKAAIISGINILLESTETRLSDINKVVLTGAFGNYLDIESGQIIGLLPRIKLDKFKQIGNAAGTGARMFLVSKKVRRIGEKIASDVKYLDLTSNPNFNKKLISNTTFPIINYRT